MTSAYARPVEITVAPANLDEAVVAELSGLLTTSPYRTALTDAISTPSSHEGLGAYVEGRLAGYAFIKESAPGSSAWFLETWVPIGNFSKDVTVALVQAALRHWATPLTWWTHGAHAEVVADVANNFDFPLSRRVLRLERSLIDPVVGGDGNYRQFQMGDEVRVAEINNAAFADHPDRSAWTVETVLATVAQAEDLLVAPATAELTAFAWLKFIDSRVGEIQVLASHPAYRGAGVGRRLLADALGQLRQRGHRLACLYVEEDNDHAKALYLNAGFVEVGQPLTAYSVPASA